MTIDPVERDRLDNENMRRLLAFTLAQDSNCIDIGAHEGVILREILRCAPNGRHIAFEPLPRFYDHLVREFPRVDVRCAALSTRGARAPSRTSRPIPATAAAASVPTRAMQIETITVATDRLDSLLPADYVPALIKIDVEGAEREVIEGGIETIARFRSVLIFEHGQGAADRYGPRPEHMFELLCRRAGLRIFDLDANGPYSEAEFVAAFDLGERWNFVAHRRRGLLPRAERPILSCVASQ